MRILPSPEPNAVLTIGCHLSVSKGFRHMGQEALSIGANTFQFFSRNPRGGAAKEIPALDASSLRELMAENGFGPILAHAPYTVNPAAAEERVKDFARRAISEDLERLELLPNNYYNIHPGFHLGDGAQAGIERLCRLLNSVLSPKMSAFLLLETMAGKGTEIGSTFEELRSIMDGLDCPDRVGVCFDTCHAYDAGYDLKGDLDGVLDKFDRAIGLSRLKAVHVNDSKNPLGSSKDRHQKIGEGYIGLPAMLRLIGHPKLGGRPFILETPHSHVSGYAEEIRLIKAGLGQSQYKDIVDKGI
jgi:deoxyribonuclease-4